MTLKKKTTVRQKAAAKKKTVVKKKTTNNKKTTARKKSAAIKKEVISHDPFAVLQAEEALMDLGADQNETAVLTNSHSDSVSTSTGNESVELPAPGEGADLAISGQSVIASQAVIDNSGAVAEPESTATEVQEMSEENEAQQADVTESSKSDVDLGDSLTIAEAESEKIELMHMITDAVPLRLNAGNVDQVDGAGLQLLAAFFKEADSKNVDISWGSVSKSLHEAAQVVGLTTVLKMDDVEIEDDGEGSAWGLF